jgi:putative flavoprotein involved in K+ transport
LKILPNSLPKFFTKNNGLSLNNFFMQQPVLDVIVVGAGQAGLCTSYFLKKYGLNHIVFERGKIGEVWRSQRWDSFRLNTPGQFNILADEGLQLPKGEFSSAAAFAGMLDEFATRHQLPVLEKVKVLSIEKRGTGMFSVMVETMGLRQNYFSRQVIIASGAQNEKKLPGFSGNISPDIQQLHTSEYRNAAQLKDGAVLVAGSGQSGVQIVEDLLDAGKKVYFSTSMVARLPRTYRGRDIMEWLLTMKFFDMRLQDVPDPVMLHLKPPQLTGIGSNRTISLQMLAKKGAVIIGKTDSAQHKKILLQPNAAQHIQFADHFSQQIKNAVNEFITKNNIDAPAPSHDEADQPDPDSGCATNISVLNLEEHNIGSIIWATGFNCDFSYIKLPVINAEGLPIHDNGIAAEDGLYFVGLPWLRTRKSLLIYGAKDDAAFIAEKAYQQSPAYHAK